MFTERTSVGLDVHARSVAAAAIDGVTGELFQSKLTPSYGHVESWLGSLPGPVAVAYEAGPTGFGLYRHLTALGVTVDQEAARNLVRAREDCRSDLMRARHRLSKLLLRHGIVYYGGDAWTGKHDIWLRHEGVPAADQQGDPADLRQ